MNDLTEKTLNTERKYTGKIISVDLLDIELPDGRKAKREVIRHGNAVAILARRPDGKFVFVRQYRKAAEEALIEVIAGGLEAGEDPIEGAKRETAEETGYDVTSIKFLTTIICTPGYCEERIHLYFAELSETAHGQDQDPDENVYPVILSEPEVEDGIRNGTIFDAKTLSAWVCYKIARCPPTAPSAARSSPAAAQGIALLATGTPPPPIPQPVTSPPFVTSPEGRVRRFRTR